MFDFLSRNNEGMIELLLMLEIFVPTITMYICTILLLGTYGFKRPFSLLILSVMLGAVMLSIIMFMKFPAIDGYEIFMFADFIGTLLMFSLSFSFLIEWMHPRWLGGRRLVYCFAAPVALIMLFVFCRLLFGRMPAVYTLADVNNALNYPEMWIRIVTFSCAIIELIVFMILLFREERKHRLSIRENFSFIEGTNLRWVHFIAAQLIAYGICLIIRDVLDMDIMRFAIGFLLTSLAVSASIMTIRQQELYFREENPVQEQEELTEEETVFFVAVDEKKDALKKKLVLLLERDEVFRDPNLSIETMYKMLHTNRTYLSQLINKDMGMNFYQLVNSYRIKKASELLRDPEQSTVTIKDIASIVGFKSLSTFNNLFKEQYDTLPSFWRMERDCDN